MKTINVCFREVKSGQFKGSVDCVFLDDVTRDFRFECYAHIGQHSEGDIDYFYNDTKPAKEYADLLKEIKSIYHDYNVNVHSRLPTRRNLIKRMKW